MHQHEKDSNYDAVILHVVWEHDMNVFGKDNLPLPTLELQSKVSNQLISKYEKFLYSKQKWIPCETQIASVDIFVVNNWLDRLYLERLEKKSVLIFELLTESENDWEAVLFQLLAKNFGLNINGEAFLQWSKSFDFSLVRKQRTDFIKLSALFYGQANLLAKDIEEPYYQSLQKEYRYLQHKYNLIPTVTPFQFYGMRPTNFPTIRMAQLVKLYHLYSNLFSKIIQLKSKKEVYKLFQIQLEDFWLTHFTFQKESPKRKKQITQSFIDLIIINTIIPLKFAYAKSQNKEGYNTFDLLKEIKPEKNSIIQKFNKIVVETKNAFETQSLLELKNNYCAKKRCLQCAIGLDLLKSK